VEVYDPSFKRDYKEFSISHCFYFTGLDIYGLATASAVPRFVGSFLTSAKAGIYPFKRSLKTISSGWGFFLSSFATVLYKFPAFILDYKDFSMGSALGFSSCKTLPEASTLPAILRLFYFAISLITIYSPFILNVKKYFPDLEFLSGT